MSGEQIGHVSAYYSKISVAAIELTATLSVGEKIRVKGTTTDFEIEVTSMQIDREAVETAGAGTGVGVQVSDKVRRNDAVFRA
jgi:putative protease